MQTTPTVFLTLPPTRPPSRRRDPFGFSEVATYYADMLAPGLTNRQRDPRWLSILCWSIQQVQHGFSALDSDKERYDRLRGLELRWVIETCQRADQGKGRQLPGSEKVRKMKKAADFASLRKEMGEDQWRRYRYVGPYAAYRGLLQSLGLLEAGGWNLTSSGKALATVADKCARITLRTASIKRNAAPTDDTTGWVPYWLRRWNLPADSAGVSTFLPTDLTALAVAERKILAPALFKESGRRHDVAVSVGKSSAAQHSTLCKHLQKDLLRKPDWALAEREKLEKFGEFASLADTAVDALKAAFKIVAEHASGSPTLGVVAKSMAAELTGLRDECAEWKRDRVWPTVDAFAREIIAVNAPEHILRKLVRFHERQAGGLVWLRIRDGGLDRAVRNDQAPGGYYRFRLDALSRLAFGCNIITSVPPCFNRITTIAPDDNEE